MRVIVHPRASLFNAIGATVVGALVAGYLTPVVAPVLERWLGPADADVEGAPALCWACTLGRNRMG